MNRPLRAGGAGQARMVERWLTTIAMMAIAVVAATSGCGEKTSGSAEDRGRDKQELTIFHAGSLSVPFREISAIFQAEHPGVTVKAEAAGSRDCARKISDLDRRCDVLGSADYTVVTALLMPEHVDFNIRFALNEMVIAYTDESRLSDKITPENWVEILLSAGVAVGRSDPNRDPCGYRALMLFQLAEKYFRMPGLARKLAGKSGEKYIRPKETELLALLEAGEIDYAVIYRSLAEQHGLKSVLLPKEVNLGSPAFADFYRTATVSVTGKRPGEFVVKTGEPMVYSVTIPKDAPNREMAEAWVRLLLSPRGRAVMERNGQPCVTPAEADGLENVPASLRQFCKQAWASRALESQQ